VLSPSRARQTIRRRTFCSAKDLATAIGHFINAYNDRRHRLLCEFLQLLSVLSRGGGWPVRISGHAMNTHASAALAVGLIAVPVAAASGHPVASRTAPAVPLPRTPALSISVTDGRAAATAGDRLTYTVSVRDSGIAAAPHLKITQTLSPGVEFVSASGNGVATAGQVAWHASLPAGGARTFQVTAQVTQTPARELRLAAVACVAQPGSSRPIVCASHLDRLPAAAAAAEPAAGSGSSRSNLTAYAAAGLAVLAAGLLTVIAGRRIRLRRRQA
jgi:uncharacterized repeat protein (TIGR01451 family)